MAAWHGTGEGGRARARTPNVRGVEPSAFPRARRPAVAAAVAVKTDMPWELLHLRLSLAPSPRMGVGATPTRTGQWGGAGCGRVHSWGRE